ncbi:MAG: glycerol-3-phosphate acyltransferase [Actinobacteria bacterium]|nr:glycerol-3-phosphate acyltransferase [Actinomycetota bacterium]
MIAAAIIVLGYLLGSCPWGYWLPLLVEHDDIRTQQKGSGNIGVTNVWRIYHARLGLPVLVLDIAKGLVPALLGVLFVSHTVGIVAGAAAMAGHWRPLYLRWQRGGKIVATSFGVFLALAPLAAGTSAILWLSLFALFGYASIASVLTGVWLPVGSWVFGYPASVVLLAVVASSVTIYLHRQNLQRLRRGTENQSSIALTRRLGFGRG